jgi:hypothetical protein
MSPLRIITGALAFWLIISAIQVMRGVTRQRLATIRQAKNKKDLDQEQEKAYRKVMNFQLLKVVVAAGLLFLLANYL